MFSRLLAFVVSLASMIVLGLAFWPQLIGLQRTSPWSFLVAPRGLALVIAVVTFVIFLLLGRFGRPLRRVLMAAGAWLLVFALATGWLLYTRGFGVAMPDRSPQTIRVLEWNTMGDAPSAEMIAQVILESDVDVVTLPETTRSTAGEIVAILRTDGVDVQSFTVAFDAVYRAHSTSLLIRESFGRYVLDESAPQTSVSPTIVARPITGDGPTIVAAHVVAPSQATMGEWRDDLGKLADLCRETDVVVAGDLNATVDSMQGLGQRNLGDCTDAALASHGAAVGTWPSWIPALVGAPIDHVLSTATWVTDGTQVLTSTDGSGSDHRPLIAQLRRLATTP